MGVDTALQKEDIELLLGHMADDFTTGCVIVQYDDYCLGSGLYFLPNGQYELVLRSLYRAP